jgi:Mrp family chromosome partitioning ATPase
MNTLDTCFAKEKELVTRDVAGEEIIVPIKGHVGDLDGVFTLNEVGAMIWRLIDGQTTVRQLMEAVRNEYDVEVPEAEKDVVDFLRSLEDAGLIRPSEGIRG